MLTWFAPVPKSMCVSLTPSAEISNVTVAPTSEVVIPLPPLNVIVSPSAIAWPPLSASMVMLLFVRLLLGMLLVLISPLAIAIPVPALMCALTSAALGPVYVITPVLLL